MFTDMIANLATRLRTDPVWQWCFGIIVFSSIFFFLLPNVPWSFDGADYVIDIQAHTYTGVTGHPVYAYLGWLFDVVFGKSLGFSPITVANIYTYVCSLGLFITATLFTRRLASLLGLDPNVFISSIFLLSTPYFLYHMAQVEVYALASCFAFVALYFLIPPHHGAPMRKYIFTSIAAISFGLGVGTHLNLVLIAPVILMLLIRGKHLQDPLQWITGIVSFGVTLVLIYAPAYPQSDGLVDLITWATAHGASGHFFAASLATFVKKTALVLAMMVTGLFVATASWRYIIKNPQKWTLIAVLVSIVSFVVLYASSPINGEIEQLLLGSMLLTILASLLFGTLPDTTKQLTLVLVGLSFAAIIPIKMAFVLKDTIISGEMRMAQENIPLGSIVFNQNTFTYLEILRPDMHIVTDPNDLALAEYFIDSTALLPLLDKNTISYEIIETWERSRLFFEAPLAAFINLPASWGHEYAVVKILHE